MDLRILHSNRSSTEINAQLSVFVELVKLDKLRSMIAGTKARLEVTFGKITDKIAIEVKGNLHTFTVQKAVKFEYRFEDELTINLIKKSPVMSFSTVVYQP